MPNYNFQRIEVTYKLDDRQFHALMHILVDIVSDDDPIRLAALTARLKASGDALTDTVKNANP
jgi:hypothetical protein